ncbi:hypothetical protein Tco_1418631 [Tanacetum coccineum]
MTTMTILQPRFKGVDHVSESNDEQPIDDFEILQTKLNNMDEQAFDNELGTEGDKKDGENRYGKVYLPELNAVDSSFSKNKNFPKLLAIFFVMVRFWMGFVSLEVDMGTYLRVEEYESFGWCVFISGGLLFVAMLLRWEGVMVIGGSESVGRHIDDIQEGLQMSPNPYDTDFQLVLIFFLLRVIHDQPF